MINHAIARDVLATGCFAAFVAGAFWSSRRGGGDTRKRRATIFTMWTLVVSLGVGITERDLYPFTSWPLIAWLYPKAYPLHRFVAVDALGGEQDVDWRAWQPMSVDELASWMARDFFRLDAAARDSVARDLLRRANSAAGRARLGERVGTFDRVFGPFSAPQFHLHPAPWQGADALPPLPFKGLRVYIETWDPDQGARTSAQVPRELVYEYRASP